MQLDFSLFSTLFYHSYFNEKSTMTNVRKRRRDESSSSSIEAKKLKRPTSAVSASSSLEAANIGDNNRPKSKKELRAERKVAKKAAAASKSTEKWLSKEEYKLRKQKLRKEKAKELRKQQMKEERDEKKLRKQKRLNRERNAAKATTQQRGKTSTDKYETKKQNRKRKSSKESSPDEQEISRQVLDEVIHGKRDEASGMTTLALGVKYKDLVVGSGDVVHNKSVVKVKYQLKGGKFGAVLDSSNNFKFRVGKGEVIQGWDIGVLGMQEGGRRKLIVPPKAGYGSQDIGAGPGGILHFDITVLSIL